MIQKIVKKIVGYKVVVEESTPEAIVEEVSEIKQVIQHKRPLRINNTWRLKPPSATHALYVTITAITIEDKKYPFEIFFNTKNPEHIEWTNALTLTISNAFRTAVITGSSLEGLISNLKETFGTSGGYLSKVPKKPKFVNGLVAEIGYVIAEFYSECLQWNYLQSSQVRETTTTTTNETETINSKVDTILDTIEKDVITNPCPICCEQLIMLDNCPTCTACGYSKCG